ncbi:MAG: cupin domain-containing protein [Opitutales bacterium]|nr:cupin domain-containing protein [Opitutales bacterium]
MDLHADHSQRIVVDATGVLQGQGAVSLERQGQGDRAQITVVAHAAGEVWMHTGEQLCELLVLQGALLIGEDSFGPQSYVRLLPGQALDLKTQTGCVLYENRRDWTETEEGSFALAGDRMDWRQGMVPGLKVTSLHEGLTKHTALVRWAPDTRFNPHTHVGGEEILVLAGVFRDEHGAYPAGTWIRSPHMSHHRPFTEAEGATILVKVGHLQVPG